VTDLRVDCHLGANGYVLSGMYSVENIGGGLAPPTMTRVQMPAPSGVIGAPPPPSFLLTQAIGPGGFTVAPTPLPGPVGPHPIGAYTVTVQANARPVPGGAPVPESDTSNNTATYRVSCP